MLQSAEVRRGWWPRLPCSSPGLKAGFTPSPGELCFPCPLLVRGSNFSQPQSQMEGAFKPGLIYAFP